VRDQDFPPGVRIAAQARGWDEAEVTAWLESRRIASPGPRSLAKPDDLEAATRR